MRTISHIAALLSRAAAPFGSYLRAGLATSFLLFLAK